MNEHQENKLDEVHATVQLLKIVVLGVDGKGGISADVRSLVSLRDRSAGVLAAIVLFGSVLVLGIKSWIISLFPGVNK